MRLLHVGAFLNLPILFLVHFEQFLRISFSVIEFPLYLVDLFIHASFYLVLCV